MVFKSPLFVPIVCLLLALTPCVALATASGSVVEF